MNIVFNSPQGVHISSIKPGEVFRVDDRAYMRLDVSTFSALDQSKYYIADLKSGKMTYTETLQVIPLVATLEIS